jgi:hypothetical protein
LRVPGDIETSRHFSSLSPLSPTHEEFNDAILAHQILDDVFAARWL